jgi:hypothetical protein
MRRRWHCLNPVLSRVAIIGELMDVARVEDEDCCALKDRRDLRLSWWIRVVPCLWVLVLIR